MANDFDYEGRTFRSVTNSATGDVGAETLFQYHQQGRMVWAEYSGGRIVKGTLLALMDDDGCLDMRYQHINSAGELMTGSCRSVPERTIDGRYRLRESWRWTCGDGSRGESVVEEVP